MTIPPDLSRFDSLVDIIAHLRGPQGCPWDRQQTHRSLREHLLEEAYEVLEALDEEIPKKLCAELGDLLMQIVMNARLAEENGNFTMNDVTAGINRKLISRHPHVFGEAAVSGAEALTAESVLIRWEELKKKERYGQGGMLDSVPRALPALAYSQSVQERVARVGFDWPDDAGILEKLAEELAEFKTAATPAERAAEFGDLIFTLANYARRQNIDLEAALREANAKFYRRFSRLEELARTRGHELGRLTLDEMNQLWDEVKTGEPG
ncbi:MAG: nucleoside triphosphate pyrophosphohydrolase [Dehalococcoidia bacterium]|nr:nucleoside triphosphate pyrophosphohydrolase [Dehalococcoidia bacterium]